MRILYFDCTNGVSGDMVYSALREFSGIKEEFAQDAKGHSHTGYSDIKLLIYNSEISEAAKEKALSIYSVIADAESSVHGTSVSEVHFHEVGRSEAVKNIVGAAACIDGLKIDKILCSEIFDGQGTIECSHGTIPVPVPAVMAMRKNCSLVFTTDESVATEMVTPSGLAILIGLGAAYSDSMPEGEILMKTTVCGTRDIGRKGGLSVYLIEA